jgi:hypothetical protein
MNFRPTQTEKGQTKQQLDHLDHVLLLLLDLLLLHQIHFVVCPGPTKRQTPTDTNNCRRDSPILPNS